MCKFREKTQILFLFLTVLAILSFATKTSAIVINEVFYDATGTDTGKEWIEFFNEDSVSIVITGYDLSAGVGDYYTFPEFTLLPESYVVVHWNTVGIDTSTDLFTGNSVDAMSNTSGFVALFNSITHNSSTIFDYVEYGAGGQTWESDAVSAGNWTTGNFVADVVAGSSIGLKTDGVDNNLSSDWTQFDIPTPGASNEPIPEPGTVALLCTGVLVLGLLRKRKKIVRYLLNVD
jgi:hypothetical protein